MSSAFEIHENAVRPLGPRLAYYAAVALLFAPLLLWSAWHHYAFGVLVAIPFATAGLYMFGLTVGIHTATFRTIDERPPTKE